MKHIKRKFSGQIKVPGGEQTIKELNDQHPPVNLQTGIPEGMKAIMFTTTGEAFYGFSWSHQGKECIIPEPDPILVYFNVAQFNYRLIVVNEGRSKLIKVLFNEIIGISTNDLMHLLYDFLGQSSTFAISLFMAIESAINRAIPDNYELKKPNLKQTFVYDYLQVQQLEFKEKVKEILPKITGKKFWIDHPVEWNFIISDLKKLRDEIVHTKKLLDTQTHYKEIYVMALNFDYKQAISYAQLFINYYHKNLVEECPCGKDF